MRTSTTPVGLLPPASRPTCTSSPTRRTPSTAYWPARRSRAGPPASSKTGWSRICIPSERPARWLLSELEAVAPVEHFGGVLGRGRDAAGGAVQGHPDQVPAVPDRLEQQAVPGVVGVAVLDPDRALVRADERAGVLPPVVVVAAALRQVVEV